MSKVDEATATQIRNIEAATGRSLVDWIETVRGTGLERHGEIVAHLKSVYGFTHGNANLIAAKARQAATGGPASADELLAAQYAGAKAVLLPIVQRLVTEARSLGGDVEIVVQKTAVSLRRTKQFGVIRPATATRVELGLNLAGMIPSGRLQAAGGMCTHRVDLRSPGDLDEEVLGWLAAAYDLAG